MLQIANFLQALSAGLLLGCVYGFMCAALGLVFGVMGLVNFAQGDLLMLGMYFALGIFTYAGLGTILGPVAATLVACVLAVPVFFVLGWLIHKFLIGPIGRGGKSMPENERRQAQLITTLGLSLVLSNGGLIIFGSTPQSINSPLSSDAWAIGSGMLMVFANKAQVLAAAVAVVIVAALYILLSRTSLGRKLRAAADNPIAAIYVGIDVAKSHRVAFGISAALTGIAGVLVANYYPFQPYVGLDFVTLMYAGVVLGGIGSVIGSFWGGLVVGLVQQLSTLVLPLQLQGTAVFAVFVLTMLVRPQGFFGRNLERA